MQLAAQILLMMIAFLSGYALGRRIGFKEACTQAETMIPLNLKRETLEKGICVICSSRFKENGIN